MKYPGRQARTAASDWADPGYFAGESKTVNALRVLIQLVRPPAGHRTLPTKTGVALILLTIGIGSAAFNTGHNILYLALSVLLSTLLVSGVLSWLNFKGCRWRMELRDRLRVGERTPVHLLLHNGKRRLPTYCLTFRVGAQREGRYASIRLPSRLEAGEEIRLLWDFVPQQRGVEYVALAGLVSRYPFGFLKKKIRDSYRREVLVWPRRIACRFHGSRAGRARPHGARRRPGEGVELVRLREYRPGDPPRKVHWKASARVGKLQVRETAQEENQSFRLFVEPDQSLWKDEAAFERMCSAAASLAEDLFQHGQLQGVQVAGEAYRPVRSQEDLYRFLDDIALLKREVVIAGEGPRGLAGAVRFRDGGNGSVVLFNEEAVLGEA